MIAAWLMCKLSLCFADVTMGLSKKETAYTKPVISLGNQSFEELRKNHSFYIDKTLLIQEWWENQDSVTLVTRL